MTPRNWQTCQREHEMEQMPFGFRRRVEQKKEVANEQTSDNQNTAVNLALICFENEVAFGCECRVWFDIAWQKRVQTDLACGYFIGTNFQCIRNNWWLTTGQNKPKKAYKFCLIFPSVCIYAHLFSTFIAENHFRFFCQIFGLALNPWNWSWFACKRAFIQSWAYTDLIEYIRWLNCG